MISHTMSLGNKTSTFQHGIILVGRSSLVARSVGLYVSIKGPFNVPHDVTLFKPPTLTPGSLSLALGVSLL